MNNTFFLLTETAHPLSIEILGGNSGGFLAQLNFFIDQSWVGNKAVHLQSASLTSLIKSGSSSQLLKPVSMNPRLDVQIS